MFFEGLSYETIFYIWWKDAVVAPCNLLHKKFNTLQLGKKKQLKKLLYNSNDLFKY